MFLGNDDPPRPNTFRLTKVIKEGGMGVVYQAIGRDGELYAVKEMHDRFSSTADRNEGIERFVDEANLLLHMPPHPAIPQVYDSFIDEGRYYLVMEFIFGEDLEDILKREHWFPEPIVLRWADQLCDVLEHMHANNLIYRDMKPSNVMITADSNVKVVDFGIAKLLQPGQRGTMIGTPGYAPPEQYQGLATPQSDVYALAATLHHLLTGRDPREEPPFSFPPARSVRSTVSRATSDALDRALQLEVEDRFKTISEFRRALPIPTGDRRPTRRFDPQPAPAPRVPQTRSPQPSPRRTPPLAPAPAPARSSQAGASRGSVAAPVRPPTRVQRQQRSRRRSGSIRRTVATVVLLAGLTYGAVQFGPTIWPIVESYFTNITQTVPNPNPAPATGFVSQYVSRDIEVEVAEGATQDQIVQAFRDAYLTSVRADTPGAQINNNVPPGLSGQEEVSRSNGMIRLRATVSGYVNVPQQ